MGPVMPPSKKAEGTGISVSSQCCRSNALSNPPHDDDDLDFPPPAVKINKEKGAMEDEELTNLNWLHESKNLLKSFGDTVLRSVSPVQDVDDDTPPSPAQSDMPYDAKQNANCKPPYSFSCLIFMAIEDSPTKRLPVKDIYNWILEHFPYFANAPTGWKNSVRHNLSLNKCFKKVDKDRSQSIGKGSLWCIDPEYRQNLIQALKKTPYHPYSHVFNTPPTSPQAYQRFYPHFGLYPLQVKPIKIQILLTYFPLLLSLCRNGIANCRVRAESEPSCGSPLVSSDPKEDHNYSSAKSSLKRSSSPASDSVSTSSADDHYEFAAKVCREGSDISFHSHESFSEAEDEDKKQIKKEPKDSFADSGYSLQHKKKQHLLKVRRIPSDALPLKKRRTEKPPESDDEEMKEAAGSLLHLAGIRSCLNNITNRTGKGQKEQKDKETTKN
uniref:Forkhead box protein N3 n=1 Tax=Leptobrachium leishanense TaxID=445787 RepID=A0A8C5R6G8_9ANUR